MPQIERIADLAKESEWRRRERSKWAARRSAAVEQGNRAESGEECCEPWVRHLGGEHHARKKNGAEPSPRDESGAP